MQSTKSDLRPWFWVVALMVLLAVAPSDADAEKPALNEVQNGSLLLRMQDGFTSATLLNTEVSMSISGLVARVSVRQEFRNTSKEWVEGIYVFPLPDKAAVDHMRLHIGERFIEGEIQEKSQAKKTYEKAKSEGRKTSLVEQRRANLFTTSVANVAPGELVAVEVEYLEDIIYLDGQFSIRFPMTITPRYIPGTELPDRSGNGWSADTDRVPDASEITPPQVSSSPAHKLSLTASINAGMPLELIASRYHPVSVAESNGLYDVSLSAGATDMDHDFELVWRPVPSASPRALTFVESVDGKPFYLLMMMPPDQEAVSAAPVPRESIFVIDTSGSMHGVSIKQAKRALQLALQRMKPGDRFNVIEFNSVSRALFNESQAVSSASVAQATRFVEALEANGGTEMLPAISMALESPVSEEHLRQVIFITDGSVGYEDQTFEIIESKIGAARLFTVGIGSAPNSWFMRKAAEAGRGTFTLISALHEVQEKMDNLFRKLEQPQVTDIDVQWPASVTTESYPETVPDLYLGEPVTVKVAASGEFLPGEQIRVNGTSTGGTWSAELPLSGASQSPGIAALWARARIEELVELERRSAQPDEIRGQIVETALSHHLMSKYTSLVAVDKTPARPADDPLHRGQIPNLMPYGQSAEAIFGFPATATDAPAMRFAGLMLLLAGALVWALQWTAGGMCRVRPNR